MSHHEPSGPRSGDRLVESLRSELGDAVRADALLAEHTTLKVGGPARAMVTIDSADELRDVAAICRRLDVPWLIVGRGSNMLVADAGWPGVAISLGRGFRGVELIDDTAHLVRLGAAEPMPVLANRLERMGLGGMAFAVAIPGSVGGAVRMNAGAHGGQMADVLLRASVMSMTDGSVREIEASDLDMAYRHTSLDADLVVLAATVLLHPGERGDLAADMADMRRWRREHQPINSPSCGSVFRNPPGDSAGRLIEAAGLKGHQVGGARISTLHANFITTGRGATATDVYSLIRLAQRRVQDHAGQALVPEVVLLGAFDEADSSPHQGAAQR